MDNEVASPPTGKRGLPRGITNTKLQVSINPRHLEMIHACTHTTSEGDPRRLMRDCDFLRALIEQGISAKLPILSPVWRINQA